MAHRPVVNMSVLPGEPTDGSGRVCIHLFVQDEKGSFVERHVLRPKTEAELQAEQGGLQCKITAGQARGRLACNPRRVPSPTVRNGVTTVTMRTDDPRAVTCPKCKASADYARLLSAQDHPPDSTTTAQPAGVQVPVGTSTPTPTQQLTPCKEGSA